MNYDQFVKICFSVMFILILINIYNAWFWMMRIKSNKVSNEKISFHMILIELWKFIFYAIFILILAYILCISCIMRITFNKISNEKIWFWLNCENLFLM